MLTYYHFKYHSKYTPLSLALKPLLTPCGVTGVYLFIHLTDEELLCARHCARVTKRPWNLYTANMETNNTHVNNE